MGIIFTLDHCQSIAERKKTQTRRIVVAGKPCHYRAGNEYAVTPGRGKYTAYKLIRTGELVFPSDYRDWWRTHHNAAFCPVRVRVTDVRQEPLTAISEADARAEGYDRELERHIWTCERCQKTFGMGGIAARTGDFSVELPYNYWKESENHDYPTTTTTRL